MTDEYTVKDLRDYIVAVVADGHKTGDENPTNWYDAPTELRDLLSYMYVPYGSSDPKGQSLVDVLDILIAEERRAPEPPAVWDQISADESNPTVALVRLSGHSLPHMGRFYRNDKTLFMLDTYDGYGSSLCYLDYIVEVKVLDISLEDML